MKVVLQALCVGVLCVSSIGCVTRYSRETVFDSDRTEVMLRGEVRGLTPVEQGYEHPATISSVRVAHILSRIDVRTDAKKGSQRVPAIPLETLYRIAEGVAQGLAKADSNQQVVVLSIRRSKHLALFDRKYLTSFIAFVRDGQLIVHLGKLDWEIPKRREDRLPEPHLDETTGKYRVLPGKHMDALGPQTLAVAWRESIFRKPTRTRVSGSGKVVRRTILLESDEEELPPLVTETPEVSEPPPDGLSPAALRALADLEEARRAGEITETQYDARREQILGGN